MLMNYHEMTMTEPRDSPEKRKQFLVICTVMAAALIHSLFTAGGLSPIVIEDGIFPGGDFVYKESKRDYAASDSLQKSIAKTDVGLKTKEYIDRMFTIYLDDTNKLSGRRLRFASGLLITDPEDQDKKDILLSKNAGKVPPSEDDLISLGAIELWPKLLYKATTLPKVKAATVQFSFTGGFVSSLLFGMRILPALRKYAAEQAGGNPVTVISTCSEPEQICTHYAPLEQGESFLLGHPDTEAYLAELGPDEWINTDGIWYTIERSFKKLKKYIGLGSKQDDETKKEEVEVSTATDASLASTEEVAIPKAVESAVTEEVAIPKEIMSERTADGKAHSVEAERATPDVVRTEVPIEKEADSVEVELTTPDVVGTEVPIEKEAADSVEAELATPEVIGVEVPIEKEAESVKEDDTHDSDTSDKTETEVESPPADTKDEL